MKSKLLWCMLTFIYLYIPCQGQNAPLIVYKISDNTKNINPNRLKDGCEDTEDRYSDIMPDGSPVKSILCVNKTNNNANINIHNKTLGYIFTAQTVLEKNDKEAQINTNKGNFSIIIEDDNNGRYIYSCSDGPKNILQSKKTCKVMTAEMCKGIIDLKKTCNSCNQAFTSFFNAANKLEEINNLKDKSNTTAQEKVKKLKTIFRSISNERIKITTANDKSKAKFFRPDGVLDLNDGPVDKIVGNILAKSDGKGAIRNTYQSLSKTLEDNVKPLFEATFKSLDEFTEECGLIINNTENSVFSSPNNNKVIANPAAGREV